LRADRLCRDNIDRALTTDLRVVDGAIPQRMFGQRGANSGARLARLGRRAGVGALEVLDGLVQVCQGLALGGKVARLLSRPQFAERAVDARHGALQCGGGLRRAGRGRGLEAPDGPEVAGAGVGSS